MMAVMAAVLLLTTPITGVGLAIAALVVGFVELYKHSELVRNIVAAVGDYFSHLWDVLKGVGSAIGAFVSNYVGSLIQAFKDVGKVLNDIIHLNFSGMVEDAKKVGGDVANAYVGSAKKAGAAFGGSLASSMKDHLHDAAVANVKKTLDEIDKNLANAALTPASKAALEKSRQDWVAYGTKIGADVGQAVQDGAADTTAFHPPVKGKKEKSGNTAEHKDKLAIEKQQADDELAIAKDKLIQLGETGKKLRADEMQAEIAHNQRMLDIAKEMSQKTKDDREKRNAAILHAQVTLQQSQTAAVEADRASQVEDLQKGTEAQLSALTTRALKMGMSANQQAEAEYKIKQDGIAKELALRKSFGEDVSKLQAQFDQSQLKHDTDTKKAHDNELRDITDRDDKAQRDQAIAQIADEHARRIAEINARNADEKAAEQKRFNEEMEKYKGNKDIEEALKAEHANKDLAIDLQTNQAKLNADTEYWIQKNALTSAGFKAIDQTATQALDSLDKGVEKSFGNQKTVLFTFVKSGLDAMKGMVGEMIKENEKKVVAFLLGDQTEAQSKTLTGAQKIASDTAVTTSDITTTAVHTTNSTIVAADEATKKASFLSTAATAISSAASTAASWVAAGGVMIAQSAIWIAKNLAAAASGMVSAVGSMVAWLTSMLGPFAIAAIPAAIAGLYGLYAGAKKVFGFSGGAILTKPVFSPLLGGGAVAGEGDGHEAILPIGLLPGMMRAAMPQQSPAQQMDLTPLVDRLDKLHGAVKSQRLVTHVDQRNNILSQAQERSSMNNRKL